MQKDIKEKKVNASCFNLIYRKEGGEKTKIGFVNYKNGYQSLVE